MSEPKELTLSELDDIESSLIGVFVELGSGVVDDCEGEVTLDGSTVRGLLAMARRLVELESALLFLKGGRSPQVYVERARELGWKPGGEE